MSQPAKIFAKKLLAISLENNRVSGDRVTAVLQTLRSNPPRRYKEILEIYLLKIGAELRKENAVIEHSGSISESAIKDIKENLSKYYNRDINVTTRNVPELLAGLSIRAADDVWDTSVLSRLEQLTQSFK